MLTNRRAISGQAGVSVIEMPIITLVLLTLMLFSAKLNQAIQIKTQLQELAYSLTALTAKQQGEVSSTGSATGSTPITTTAKFEISDGFADSMLLVAQRHLGVILTDSSASIGIHIEQVNFSSNTAPAKPFDKVVGSECMSAKSLNSLYHLAPKGRVVGINAGQRASLFQVTICVTDMAGFAANFASILNASFTDDYYRSSALLIGRVYD